jgi:hypothetical protein
MRYISDTAIICPYEDGWNSGAAILGTIHSLLTSQGPAWLGLGEQLAGMFANGFHSTVILDRLTWCSANG